MNGIPNPTPAGTAEHPVAPWGNESVWNVGDGENAKPWHALIPEEPVRQLMETKAYKNPAELAVAYHNLNKAYNGAGDVVVIPGDGATPEQIKAFNTKLGIPETPEGYTFTAPDGQTLDPKMVEFGRKFLHDIGVPASKADKAMEMWNNFVAEQSTALGAQSAAENDTAIAALEQRWGADLEANRAAGLRVLNSLNAPELVAKVESAIGAAPLVELLALIGQKTGEAGFQDNPAGNPDPNNVATMTKEQAAARIQQLNGDAAFQAKYTDAKHPEHKAAVEHMNQLYAKA